MYSFEDGMIDPEQGREKNRQVPVWKQRAGLIK